jgi:hypothetical protein
MQIFVYRFKEGTDEPPKADLEKQYCGIDIGTYENRVN